jgi:phosphoethanolamine N-methyltransferase
MAVDAMVAVDTMNRTRSDMEKYWQQHSKEGSIEEMMLDDGAQAIEAQDCEEILSLQPELPGKHVLELAAGIGRFTGHLAQRVGATGSVTAVEFMQNFSDQNEATHRHPNTHFICADVTRLERPEGSCDVIFINWLLMYLGDEEVTAFARNALRWLAPGGHLFFRESCLQQSGSKKRDFNPTQYRAPEAYDAIFGCADLGAYPAGCCFRKVRQQSSQTYLEHKGNPNQVTWLWQKVALTN